MKKTSTGYKREQSKKRKGTVRDRADNLFHLNTELHHVQPKKSLLLDNFSLKSQQLVPNHFIYPYECLDSHLRKIWRQFVSK